MKAGKDKSLATSCVIGVILVASSGFRILGAFGWLIERGLDVPFLTMIASVFVAAIPGFGLWASYTWHAQNALGAIGGAAVLAPTLYAEALVFMLIIGFISESFSKDRG